MFALKDENVMVEEAARVVIPESAPAVETSKALESSEKLSPLSPRDITPVAVRVCPLATVNPPLADMRPLEARVPVIDVLSSREMFVEAPPESMTMFPVVPAPRVRVCPLVVARLPAPVRYVAFAPEFAEIEAVGVLSPALFRNANLAVVVAVEPNRTSYVLFD